MLETEEVDDDFFTPVASTSLASIFGNVSKTKDSTENDSLKYIPPKPQNLIPKKNEPTKVTECVLACALIAHEWCNNVYVSRGKLGFAIIKIQNTGDHNIILYDSHKTTLSSTAISPQLEVTIKNGTYISFYDILQRYWSIYGTNEEIQKIECLLKCLGAVVNYSNQLDKGLLEPNDSVKEANASIEESVQQNRESDTDSSVNRKTKASILNRMANMGHSVLPSRNLPVERTSDSSDANENEIQPKTVRHKTTKPFMKKSNIEFVPESHHRAQQMADTESEKNMAIFSHHSQLVPLSNTSIISNPSNEMNMFLTEQRINNSELRINMNRITDKVDSVMDKINSIQYNSPPTNVSTDILLKLLAEYENKIKVYEELLKPQGTSKTKVAENQLILKNEEIGVLTNKLVETEKINNDKNSELDNLRKEIQFLKDKDTQNKDNYDKRERELVAKVNNLEDSLKEKSKKIECNTDVDPNNTDIQGKVKNIMNDTYQTISMNFVDNTQYSGEVVKRIVGTVIKKITINMLSELNQGYNLDTH